MLPYIRSMKKIFSLKVFALLFLLSNALFAAAQKKKTASPKKVVAKNKVVDKKMMVTKNKVVEKKNILAKSKVVEKKKLVTKNDKRKKIKIFNPLDSITAVLKGHLLLPFDDYKVQMPYGTCTIGEHNKIDNPGITFASNAGSKVRAAWNGVVSSITMIDNMYVVIVKCGSLFLGYSNLSKPSVKENDPVTKGQFLGKLGTDDNGTYAMDFLLFAGNRLNPTDWFDWNKCNTVDYTMLQKVK